MSAIAASFRGFRTLVRLNMDWLLFSVVLLIALYSGAYIMLS